MTSISVNDLSLSFGIKPVLEKVSFSLEEGDKLGIIGVNGCGKSTLFKLILGELEPDEGNIFFSNGKSHNAELGLSNKQMTDGSGC